jgi:tetratricopeptide (TPR) repeat protein
MGTKTSRLNLRYTLIGIASFLIIILIIYGKTFNFPLLHWDDDLNISQNSLLKDQDWASFWTQPYFALYIPITYSFWLLLAKFFDVTSGTPFHCANLVLHFMNTVLVYTLIPKILNYQRSERSERDLPSVWLAAWIGAAFFCCHPLQVDVVAWASGMRDLLNAFFGLLAIHFFLYSSKKKFQALAFVSYACGMLSKPSIIALPLALLLLRGPTEKRFFKPLSFLPWILLGFVIIWITQKAQIGTIKPPEINLLLRPLVVIDSLTFYFSKFLVPVGLAINYPHTISDVLSAPSIFLSLFIFTLFVGIIYNLSNHLSLLERRIALMAPVLLLPVLGAIPFSYQSLSTVANHYAYFPLVGVSICISLAWSRLGQRRSFQILIALFLMAFASQALNRTEYWKSDEVFFTQMIQDNPKNAAAHVALGNLEAAKKNDLKARELYLKAHQLAPNSGPALANYAMTLVRLKNWQEITDVFGPTIKTIFTDPLNLASKPLLTSTSNFTSKFTSQDTVFIFEFLKTLTVAQIHLNQWSEAHQTFCKFLLLPLLDIQVIQKLHDGLLSEMKPTPNLNITLDLNSCRKTNGN